MKTPVARVEQNQETGHKRLLSPMTSLSVYSQAPTLRRISTNTANNRT